MNNEICEKCGSLDIVEEIMTEGYVHYSKISCKDCGHFLGWGKKPSNLNSNTRNNNDKFKERHRLKNGGLKCVWCGADERLYNTHLGWNFQLDHIVLISEGGADSFENTQILCFACHEDKNMRRKQVKLIYERLEPVIRASTG